MLSFQPFRHALGPLVVGVLSLLCVGVPIPARIAAARIAAADGVISVSGKVTAKKMSTVKNSVVYLEQVAGNHKPAAEPVRIDQINQTFSPFVAPVVVGTTVNFLNNDNTLHSVFSPDGEKYDLGQWDKGETRHYTFKQQGVYTQLCKLHPQMVAYILVLQNPYFAITKDDGSFEIPIPDLPPGEYKLAVWNERKKAAPLTVKIEAAPVSDIKIELGK